MFRLLYNDQQVATGIFTWAAKHLTIPSSLQVCVFFNIIFAIDVYMMHEPFMLKNHVKCKPDLTYIILNYSLEKQILIIEKAMLDH